MQDEWGLKKRKRVWAAFGFSGSFDQELRIMDSS
jgi:hypothetical protein